MTRIIIGNWVGSSTDRNTKRHVVCSSKSSEEVTRQTAEICDWAEEFENLQACLDCEWATATSNKVSCYASADPKVAISEAETIKFAEFVQGDTAAEDE